MLDEVPLFNRDGLKLIRFSKRDVLVGNRYNSFMLTTQTDTTWFAEYRQVLA